LKNLDPGVALTHGLELFRLSDNHRNYTVTDIYTYLQLPIEHKKIRLYYENDKPVGLITWCWMYRQDSDRFLVGEYHPQIDDYKYDLPKSKELWCMEVIAPYGHAKQMIRSIINTTKEVYGSQKVNWRRLHSKDKRRAKRFNT